MQRMFAAMQGMHRITRSLVAGMTPMLTACQRATARMADLVDSSGFVMRIIDQQGRQVFDVSSVDTDKQMDADYYDLPSGMRIVDMNEKMKQVSKQGQQTLQQMPNMEQMMKQIQQSGGEMTPEMQQQLQQMMEQLQQPPQ
jgi:DNA replication protein DnaD